ncbi:rRNA pseudouridine synthase [Patescibacteria group bacterium]|nr:rRNA pseudouridine synthase [Patescibacteria group bacterium]
MALVRLQKAIADAGICSRRKAEELISLGKVEVNGKVVQEMGNKVNISKDEIKVESRKLKVESNNIYILLNKPTGYICSASNKQGKSVLDLLTSENSLTHKPINPFRLYPVGRLDKDSDGLVLLTNDGELTDLLTHPRYEHEKEYEVNISKNLSSTDQKKLESNMIIGEDNVRGLKIKKILNNKKGQTVTVVLKEGKNRQIRRMFGQFGYDVLSLRRIRMGELKLGTLPIGKWKKIKKEQIVN